MKTRAPVGAEPGAPRAPQPFIGRGREIESLLRSLETALSGLPQATLVVGEAGIGKTRLLREFQAAARQRSVEVCAGRGYDEFTVPFLPFIEALEPRLRTLPTAMERALGPDAAIIRALLQGEGGAPAKPAASPDDEDRMRVHLAVARAVIELARRGPLVLTLDDLHWVDQASLDLFAHLVLSVADIAGHESLPLLIVGSTRPFDHEPHIARAVGRFQREAICQTLELGGLDEAEVSQLLGSLGVARASHQVVAAVNDATRGNPLFVQEVVHRLVKQSGGVSSLSFDLAVSPLEGYLPADVVGAITARVRDLGEEARGVLTLAAFLGEPFALRVLSAVTGHEERDLLRVLDEALAQGLLVTDQRGFQFAHALIRQVFYSEPTPAVRQQCHAQIAAVLVSMHAGRRDEDVLEIAHHLIAAGTAVEAATVFTYAQRAAERAFAGASWRDAARYYQAALAADDVAHCLVPPERAALHYQAGVAHFRDQDAGPCLAQFERAIAEFEQCGDARGLGRALIGKTRAHLTLAAVAFGTLVDTAPLHAAAERVADEDPALCGAIWAEMAQVFWTARQPAQGEEMARRALLIGERLGDDALAAEALRALWLVQSQTMQVPAALESLEVGLALAQRSGDVWIESHLKQRVPLTLVWLGRFDEAAAAAAAATELTQVTHDWGDHSLALGALVCVAVARGDFAAAERHAQQVERMRYRSGYPWAGPTAMPAMACAHLWRGDCAAAEHTLATLAEPGQVFEDPGPAILVSSYLLRAVVAAYADPTDDGRAAVRGRVIAMPRATANESADVYALGVFGAVVDLADLLADAVMAEAALDPLVRAAEHGVRFSTGWITLIPRALGVVATLQRDWSRASGWFDTAIEQASSAHAQPELGRAYLDYARLLIARGRRTDRSRARDLLGRAGAIFAALGMVLFARQAGVLAESLEARLPAPGRTAGRATLSRREREILLRLARGRSDAEIARELVLNPETVGRDVRRVLARFGVTSRAEAAAAAVSQGLIPALPPATAGAPPLRIIFFTDMEGSTELFDRLGDESARALGRGHDAIIRDWLRRCDGVELSYLGDGMMASFASVGAATTCAVGIQRALTEYNAQHPGHTIKVRIGLNAGNPIDEDGQLFGAAVNATARICERARPGQILVAEAVRDLATGQELRFVDCGLVPLRGFKQRFHLFEVPW